MPQSATSRVEGTLTPNQRAGQTKRERTRRRILEATEALLRETPGGYDEVRIADIAERAGTSIATVHQTYGQKATIIADLFSTLYRPVYDETQRKLNEEPTTALDVLSDHLDRLGRAAGRKPALTRAYVRAYAAEALVRAPAEPEPSAIRQPADTCQTIIDRARRTGSLPECFSVGPALGAQMTLFLLSLVAQAAPDDIGTVTERVIDMLLSRHDPRQKEN
jgi:AcrR family transcriptional regulator